MIECSDITDFDVDLPLSPPLCSVEDEENELIGGNVCRFKRQKISEEDDERKYIPILNGCHLAKPNWESGTTLTSGYVKHGCLASLLTNNEPLFKLYQKAIISLFGYKFLSTTALVEQRQKLFCLLRQTMNDFENEQTDSGNTQYFHHNTMFPENQSLYVNTRHQCSEFFLYIITFITRNKDTFLQINDDMISVQAWKLLPSVLKTDLNKFWLFLGPINKLPNTCFMKYANGDISTRTLSPSSHWLHLHLELKLASLEILSRLYTIHGQSIEQLAEFEEKCQAFLMDLIYLTSHINISKMGCMVVKTSPFLCACIKELWIIMIHLLDKFSTTFGTKSFWSVLTTIFTGILQKDEEQNRENSVSRISCTNPEKLCWWLLVHIAPLYWYNTSGEYTMRDNANIPGNWILVQDLLKLSFHSKIAKIPEELSRTYLTSCLNIYQHWHPNNDVVLYLWDYFQKKMNELFQMTGLHPMGFTRQMPLRWFENTMEKCDKPMLSNENENSFQLFLRIVTIHLKKLKITKPLQGWKQLKGRFYSKFHKKRMQELSEQGLIHFVNLFITLAYIEDLEDVANKMISFMELLDFKSLEFNKRCCVLKGYFVLLFLHKYKQTKLDNIAQKISTIFNNICREYKEICRDKTQRHHTWSLISLYLECVQEILEYKNVECLGDHEIIGSGFDILFPVCGEKELQKLTMFTRSILVIISNELEEESSFKSALAQTLWQFIFPHISQRALSSSNRSEMTNLIVSFTLLSIQHRPTNEAYNFDNLIQRFGTNEGTPSSVSCSYLGSLLMSPQALELVQTSDYQSSIIRTWFRCALQISTQNKHLQDLTRIVFLKIPKMCDIIPTQRSLVAGNVESALISFVKNLGEEFSKLELLVDMIEFRKKALYYFGDVLTYMENVVKQAAPLDLMRLSYKVAAHLLKYCAKIVYKKTQHDCLLPQIIDQLVVPSNKKKPIPAPLEQCIKLNLTEFLEGLAALDFRRDEFIKRKITQIFSRYFSPIIQECYHSSSKILKNPFLESLKNTFLSTVSRDASDFRQFLLSIIKEKAFVSPRPNNKDCLPTLVYLKELFKRTSSSNETARNVPGVIQEILVCVLSCGPTTPATKSSPLRKEVKAVLQLMLTSCKKAEDSTIRTGLIHSFKEFLTINIANVPDIIFDVFSTVAECDADLILQFIPTAKQVIVDCENKRGVGNDTRLRFKFQVFVEKLGPIASHFLTDFV